MNFKPQTKTLKNNLRLITLNLPQSPSVTALIMVKVGSRYENDKIAGLSHFIEHMVFKGTKKYPTAFKLSSVIDSIGAEFNAFTSKENTCFYVKSSADQLSLSLDILSQMIFKPLLKQKEINKEKGVILEEINMREDIPMSKVSEEFEALVYGKTPLGRDVIGFRKTVKEMKRDNFLAYRRQWYQPSRMALAIIGGIKSQKSVKENLNKYFLKNYSQQSAAVGQKGQISQEKEPEKLNFSQQKPALRIKYQKTKQAHFCLGARAFPRGHKDRYVMALLAIILGGNMSSRLFTEVREKRGLAYYIKTDVNTYFDNGYLVSQAGTDINKAEEAIKIILNEYQKISGDKISNQELKRAKEYFKGKMALGLEDSKGLATLFSEDLLLDGKIRTPQKIISGVEKVSLSDLKRVGKKIFTNQGLNLAIIGPYKDKKKFEKILRV